MEVSCVAGFRCCLPLLHSLLKKKKKEQSTGKSCSAFCAVLLIFTGQSALQHRSFTFVQHKAGLISLQFSFSFFFFFCVCVCVCVYFSFTFCATQRTRVLSAHRCVKLYFTNESTVLYFGPFFL